MAQMFRLAALGCLAAASAIGNEPKATGLRFVAVGDWGGVDDRQPTTTGQIETAQGMANVARSLGADLVLLLGDNFYDHGVDQVSSPRFQSTYESVYSKAPLDSLPFHVVAGNHDHLGDVQAQIDYCSKDSRWHFPSLYYNITRTWTAASGQARTVELYMVDTVDLVGNSDGPWGHLNGSSLRGPEDAARAEAQWSWLESSLQASKADFLWVAGHYPIYSAGEDGTTSALVQRLLPMLQKVGAHYLSGHDHMFEHLLSGSVNMFVAGAGRECCYKDDHLATVPQGAMQFMVSGDAGGGSHVGPPVAGSVAGGFASFEFGDEAVQVMFHKEDGAVIYTPAGIPRRKQAVVVV